jgi:hypothetical protein
MQPAHSKRLLTSEPDGLDDGREEFHSHYAFIPSITLYKQVKTMIFVVDSHHEFV